MKTSRKNKLFPINLKILWTVSVYFYKSKKVCFALKNILFSTSLFMSKSANTLLFIVNYMLHQMISLFLSTHNKEDKRLHKSKVCKKQQMLRLVLRLRLRLCVFFHPFRFLICHLEERESFQIRSYWNMMSSISNIFFFNPFSTFLLRSKSANGHNLVLYKFS